ncbi:hypothetical protein K6959_16395 [Bacillus aquiflavi]|uniref:YycH family regulatory protein n=1 Tax=Bacillus aquiflavi TaxID=2672567 RepID=UPI001CA841CA|nr:two-component system activity regulator YycH [Bacillus aquiflavi]UAC48131.1 hypothetical protein K6959_16395 [Bacillus aquiflavi]
MTYEKIKSIILALLVLASIFLTWSLWTYQPNYETMKKTNYIEEVSFGDKREIADIIKPEKVLYHKEESDFGTYDEGEIDKITTELSEWLFYKLKDISMSIKKEDFSELVHGAGKVEIVFPDLVPIDQYKHLLNFYDRKLPNFEFDRIVIDIENSQKEEGTVYFIAENKKKVYASDVSSSLIRGFERNFYRGADRHPQYMAYETENKTIFFPKEEPVLPQFKYVPEILEPELLKDALFTDPSFVQKTFLTSGEEFTDGSSMMTVSYENRLLSYVNPAEESDDPFTSSEIIQRSIKFVNEHGGWTDHYRFVDSSGQSVTFRLYVKGVPVFNDWGTSEIIQVWGKNQIYKYIRPYLTLDILLPAEVLDVTLPPGSKVIEHLEAIEGFNPASLDDLVPGYRMIKDAQQPRLIILEPSWYYRYNHTWERVSMEDLGGLKYGLE